LHHFELWHHGCLFTAVYMPNVTSILSHILTCQQWTCGLRARHAVVINVPYLWQPYGLLKWILLLWQEQCIQTHIIWYIYLRILHFTLSHIRGYNSRHDTTKLREYDSFFTVSCVWYKCISEETNQQLGYQSQLYFFRHIMFKLCCMFHLFHKAIIRHKHKNITLY